MGEYRGVVIEESLADRTVLNDIQIESTQVENVTEKHSTPWLTQWTLLTVLVPANAAVETAQTLSVNFDTAHRGSWYADFKNDTQHYVIFPSKIFIINRGSQEEYDAARDYGVSIGIPPHQVDFHPSVEDRER
jgi:hypothetical protein